MMVGRVASRARRDMDKERQWRALMDQHRQGGESVRAFCRERGLKEASFYRWRQEIRRRDREAEMLPLPSEALSSEALSSEASVLAPVVMVEELCGKEPCDKAKNSSASAAIEIELRGGTVVRVPSNSTSEQLGMVLDALERSRC